MNKLNQLGALLLIFLATACQASSPENQETTETTQAVVEADLSPTPTTTVNQETPLTEEETVVQEEELPTTESNEISATTETASKTPSSPPKAKAVVYQPNAETSPVKKTPTASVTEVENTSATEETSTPAAIKKEKPVAPVAPAPETKAEEKPEEPVVVKDAPPAHDSWNKLLSQFVSSTGKVNYRALKGKISELETYLKLLADNPVQSSWSRNEKMAYWINAYNAFTVKLILDNYPLSSITSLSGGKVWDKKWIKLGDKTYSLNNIENDILRPRYKDARIHFAVNCAAKSCPPLLNRAWTAANLNSNLSQQAKKFINNSAFNQVGTNKVVISKIFEWYAADFGNIVDYLNKYANTKINANAQVSYQEYDWALNQ